jgi:arsenate reductase (thioredoxin)
MFVILNVSTGAKEKGVIAGVAVGSVIALEALFAGPVSGASMNPPRSLAPAFVSMRLKSLWVYLIAPSSERSRASAPAVAFRRRVVVARRRDGRDHMTTPPPAKRVVFVCVENANRSQMAEAFARMHGAGRVEPYSAGSRPSGQVNPKAVEAMREVGYDLTKHRSKNLSDLAGIEFDAAVTMGCGDECPFIKAKRRVDWDIPDPKQMPPDQFREVRNLIEQQVQGLLRQI